MICDIANTLMAAEMFTSFHIDKEKPQNMREWRKLSLGRTKIETKAHQQNVVDNP